jgi:lipoate-protein ligase A
MLYIYNTSTNPYFNLAAEEYFLKEFDEECFMLWRNEPSIIIGKNQNALSEINVEYVTKNNIPVVRRLSGGGAVFHDLGNVNFTFIINGDESDFTDFKKFTEPIIGALKELSINAEFSGRNDLTIDGKKFSGNAQYKYKNRILHHGTLLFSSNITDLSAALIPKPSKFEGKSVKSVSSRVTNISQHLKEPITISEFINLIMNYILKTNNGQTLYDLTPYDIERINEMVKTKYNTWEWNFGSSPNYSFKNEKKFDSGLVEVNLNVEKGIIRGVKIFGDFFGKSDVSDIEKALIGVNHSKEAIHKALSSFDINNYFSNISLENLIDLFF